VLAVALEECGRFEPSIRTITKVTIDPVEIAGVALDRGTFVTIRVAAVQRDPAAFRSPHEFRLDRVAEPGQLAFGVGRHYCLGAALGRMEVAEIVGGVVRRAGAAQLAPGAELDVHGFGVVHRLPIRLSS